VDVLKKLPRKTVFGVLAGLVLVMILHAAALDVWWAAGAITSAIVYLLVRSFIAGRRKPTPLTFDAAHQIEWSRSEKRYGPVLLALFGISPVYLLFLTLWIGLDFTNAMSWLKACSGFIDLMKPFMPMPDRTIQLKQIGGSFDQITILVHFAVIGQLGAILTTVLALGFTARYAPTAIKRSESKERIPLRFLIGAVIGVGVIALMSAIVPAQLLFSIHSGMLGLNYVNIVAFFALLPTTIGFFTWAATLAILLAIHRGVRLR
jgi:hypothetical protein